ncbi:MAG: VWA domain-containing protein [Rikenellaceae bacterium]
MHFASPNILFVLLLIIPMVGYYIYRTWRGGATLTLSTIDGVRKAPRTIRYYLRHLPIVLRTLAFAAMVVALARPQTVEMSRNATSEGIDIVLALDISGSMLARDFEPDRITAAKQVATSFINDRYGDRIALVAFAGETFTLSPLTTDQGALQTLIAPLRSGVVEDGTAIGNGLATALNRLRESEAKSKVIILLTDGVNNRGEMSPQTAAMIAKEMGVKVYTIGVGTEGTAPYPRVDPFGNIIDYVQAKVEIDEAVLRQIAESTGGEYFRATNNDKLEAIYEQINTMEKSEVEIAERTLYHEKFLVWVVAALSLLVAEFLTKFLILKRLP